MRSSIKVKLIIITSLLVIIPMSVLGFFSYKKSAESLNDLGATNLKNSVEMTIRMIESLHEEVENGSLTLEQAQEKVIIAILGEKSEDGTRLINRDMDLGENGYSFVLDQEGTLLAHPNSEGENYIDQLDSNGVNFTLAMIESGNKGGGITYYEWPLPNNENQIERKVTYSKTDPHWGWVVNASTYMLDFNKPAKEIMVANITAGGFSLAAVFVIIWLIANSMSNSIKTVMDRMSQLTERDLSLPPLQLKRKDEIGKLAMAMNDMQERLRGMINNIFNASEAVSSHSEELTQSASEVKAGSEQVSITMQELAAGSEKQANSTMELSEIMGTFVAKVQESYESGEKTLEDAKETYMLTNEGSQLMAQSKEKMENIYQLVKESVERMEGLDRQSQEISKLVTVIQDIADQTNLLALNAAIEAARAGEQGRGFAVVADEVRKLAEQVSLSVTDITNIVGNIQRESSNVVTALQGGYEEVEDGAKQIITTNETFEKISHAVDDMAKQIQTITNNLATMSQESQEVNASIEEIASISEESAAGIEETSASAQEASSSMEEVAMSSTELARLAEELNELVGRFKL